MSSRINARISDELAERIERVQERTGVSLTDLVRRGLERACDEAEDESLGPLAIFERNGFVGCALGPEDGSARIKDYVREHLESKP